MIKEDLQNFFYKFLSKNTKYPCILEEIELSHEDIKMLGGYPIIRYAVDEIETTAEGILISQEKANDKIIEKYKFNASYMLTFNVFYKSDKPYSIDDLIYELSNNKQFTRATQNIDNTKLSFKDIVLRGKLNIVNVNEYLQDQTISNDRYQQTFIIDVVREHIIPIAKQEIIKEENDNEISDK